MKNYADYHVALKLLLRKGDEYLFLKCGKPDHPSHFDLPGGRVDKGEENIALADILAREIKEELGPDLIYTLGKPLFQFRRFFPAVGHQIFLTVFDGTYESGALVLSDEHSGYVWLNPSQKLLLRENFLNGEEFEAFSQYFS